MPFGRKKNLDASSKRKTKCKKIVHRSKQATPSPPSEPNATTPPLSFNPSDQPTRIDSMSTLMPEPALSTSEEDAIGPSSSDSEDDEIDQF